jgi:hypothetical protein
MYGINDLISHELSIYKNDYGFKDGITVIESRKSKTLVGNNVIFCSFYPLKSSVKVFQFSYLDFLLHVTAMHKLEPTKLLTLIKDIPQDTKIFFSPNWVINQKIPKDQKVFSREEVINIINKAPTLDDKKIYPLIIENISSDRFFLIDYKNGNSYLFYTIKSKLPGISSDIFLGAVEPSCFSQKNELRKNRLQRLVKLNFHDEE